MEDRKKNRWFQDEVLNYRLRFDPSFSYESADGHQIIATNEQLRTKQTLNRASFARLNERNPVVAQPNAQLVPLDPQVQFDIILKPIKENKLKISQRMK